MTDECSSQWFDSPRSCSKATYIVAIFFAIAAFIGTLISNIWAGVAHHTLLKTCQDIETNNGLFTCSRELAACHMVSMLVRRDETERQTACIETVG